MLTVEQLKEAARSQATHYKKESFGHTLYKVTEKNGIYKIHTKHFSGAWVLLTKDAVEIPEELIKLNFDSLITDAMLIDVASCLDGMIKDNGRWKLSQHIRKVLTV